MKNLLIKGENRRGLAHPIWHEPRLKYTNKDIAKLFPKMDKQGRRYTTVPIHAPGETVKGKSS